MFVETLSSIFLWIIAGVLVLAAVLCAVIHRWAGRILVLAVAAMLAVIAFAAREQVGAIPQDHPSELCHGAVTWFGIELTASDEFCAAWR
jgi:hypothetical protein